MSCQPSCPTPGLISLDTVFMTYASLKHVGLNALRICCNKEARTAVVESAGARILRRAGSRGSKLCRGYLPDTANNEVIPFHSPN